MTDNKYSKCNRSKRVNTIIEIRKEILYAIHEACEGLDREVYTLDERDTIKKEFRAIAEMIRDKDKFVRRAICLEKISKKERHQPTPLVAWVRQSTMQMISKKRDSIVATQYDDDELEIVKSELEEMELLVTEKDRLRPNFYGYTNEKKCSKGCNIHVSRFFNTECEPNAK